MSSELVDLQIDYAKVRLFRPDPCHLLYKTETLYLKINAKPSYYATLKPSDNTALRSVDGLVMQLDPVDGAGLDKQNLQLESTQTSIQLQLDYEVLSMQANKTLARQAMSDVSAPERSLSDQDPITLISLAQINQELTLTVVSGTQKRVNVALECGLIEENMPNATTADLIKVSLSKSDVTILTAPSNVSFPCSICGQNLVDQQTVVCHIRLGNSVIRNVIPQLTEVRKAPVRFPPALIAVLAGITVAAVTLLIVVVRLARRRAKARLAQETAGKRSQESKPEQKKLIKRIPAKVVVRQ